MMCLQNNHPLEQPQLFFLPLELKARILTEMRQQKIPYNSYLFQNLPAHSQEAYDKAAVCFQKAGWTGDTNRMAGISSCVSANDLFHACCQLFGPNMDLEEAERMRHMENKASDTYLQNYADMTGIPILKKGV